MRKARVSAIITTEGAMLPTHIQYNGELLAVSRVVSVKNMESSKNRQRMLWYSVVIDGRAGELYFKPSDEITGNRIGTWYIPA